MGLAKSRGLWANGYHEVALNHRHNGSTAYGRAAGTCWKNREGSRSRHCPPGPDTPHSRCPSGHLPPSPSSLRPTNCPPACIPRETPSRGARQHHVNLDPNEAGASALAIIRLQVAPITQQLITSPAPPARPSEAASPFSWQTGS